MQKNAEEYAVECAWNDLGTSNIFVVQLTFATAIKFGEVALLVFVYKKTSPSLKMWERSICQSNFRYRQFSIPNNDTPSTDCYSSTEARDTFEVRYLLIECNDQVCWKLLTRAKASRKRHLPLSCRQLPKHTFTHSPMARKWLRIAP